MPRNGCNDANGTNGSGIGATSSGASCSGGGAGASTNNTRLAGSDGCIYPDEVIMAEGVSFNVRYTGCIEIKTSMKTLDFSSRTQLARECINRVCESAGLKSVSKRRVEKRIQQYISERPCMKNAGTNGIMNISSRAFTLVNVDTGEIIANHNLPRVSFASGGDTETLDFLAYIAKNEDEWRACYVLECINGQCEDLIVTIGKAFMLRYNALITTEPSPENFNKVPGSKELVKDYYNDLPNKLPPDLLTDKDFQAPQQPQHKFQYNSNGSKLQQQLPQQNNAQTHQSSSHQQTTTGGATPRVAQLNINKTRDRLSSNLIDLNSPPPDQTTSKINLSNFDPMKESSNAIPTPPVRDVFDIPPFSLTAEVQRSQLMIESWFHAAISRPIAESLLKNDGDFLVRESQGKHGQYVLTGLEGKTPKHLLLIDPEGVVRTKDRIFDSISHLINYHWTNSLPIISEDSELVLRNPVHRQILSTTTTTTHTTHSATTSGAAALAVGPLSTHTSIIAANTVINNC